MICNLLSIASRTDYGRTQPVRVVVAGPDGNEYEAYLKAPHLGERPFPYLLEREWFASRIARYLELPCAPAVQVSLTPEVVAGIPDASLRTRLQAGPEVLFSTLSGGPGWIEWSDAIPIPRRNLQQAAEIYFFDTIIQNWDRSPHNPNLLTKGGNFLMIDHGEAFVSATGTEAARDYHASPWRLGGVQNHEGEYEMHVLWPKLRPKNHISFEAAAQRWKTLPDDVFELIATEVPDCWNRPTASRIVAYMTEAVRNIDDIVANIEHNFDR